MMEKTLDLATLQNLMGHANIQTTEGYVRMVRKMKRMEMMREQSSIDRAYKGET